MPDKPMSQWTNEELEEEVLKGLGAQDTKDDEEE